MRFMVRIIYYVTEGISKDNKTVNVYYKLISSHMLMKNLSKNQFLW